MDIHWRSLQLLRPARELRELAILEAISGGSGVRQRELAAAAGISLTMANAYVDRLLERGWIDVTGETNRAYRYHLTDMGRRAARGWLRRLEAEAAGLVAGVAEELRRREVAAPMSLVEDRARCG